MGEPKHDGLAIPSRVVLAHELPFTLGNLRISPAIRLVETADGSEIIEPRVMQVLVALARVDGRIVTRDELIARCWEGRIVGEDAINRTLSRIRHIAAEIGEGSFKVETITKVGYRLVDHGDHRRRETNDAVRAGSAPPQVAYSRVVAAAVTLIGFLALILWQFVSRGPAAPTIAVAPAVASSDSARELAESIALDLSRYPNGSAGLLRVVDPSKSASSADYRVEVRTRRTADGLTGDLTLEKAGKSQILWSAPVGVPGGAIVDLRQQAVSTLSDVLDCLAETRAGRARISDKGLVIYLKGCGMLSDVDTDAPSEEVLRVWRQLTSTEPKFASGWAYLALFSVLPWPFAPADRRAALIHDAQVALNKAKSIDSDLPAVFAADANLPENWLDPSKAMAILQRGLKRNPDSALLHGMRSDLLRTVGRYQEAIDEALKAMELKPLSPAERQRYVSLLAYAGQSQKAFDELRKAEEIWPGSTVLREGRYRLDLRYGDPKNAQRQLQKMAVNNKRPIPMESAWEAFIEARINPTSANVCNGWKADVA